MGSPLVDKLEAFWVWVASGACLIKPRSGASLIPLVPNHHQRQIHRAMLRQALAGRPVRVVVLKMRRSGCSTWWQALAYFLTRSTPQWQSQTVAHQIESTLDIFEIAKRIHANDPGRLKLLRGGRREMAFPHDSRFVTHTAGGHFIGSGSGLNALCLDEYAKWPNEHISVAEQTASIMQAIPNDPNSLVLIASTSNMRDSSAQFETRFRMAMQAESGWEAVFTPWFAEDTYRTPGESAGELSEYEQRLRDVHGVSDEQIVWRRRKKRDDYADSELLFAQDYPSEIDEAFQAAVGRIFPMLAKDRHAVRMVGDRMATAEIYRGIDWGGRHPFVCVWIAHWPGESAFTVDTQACPNVWKCLTMWSRDEKGKPLEACKDGVDPVRYCVMTMRLSGHVHVFRELYVANSGHRGLSELDLANRIKEESKAISVITTIADRSRPNSINLFCQHDIPTIPAYRPEASLAGEIEDGIAVLTALMQGTVKIDPNRPQPELAERELALQQRVPVRYGITDAALVLEMRACKAKQSRQVHPFLGACG